MNLNNILIPTKVAGPDMTVREVFSECIRAHIPALPFCDDKAQITGRVTLKNILKTSCLPEYMVDLAQVLGEQLSCTQNVEAKAKELLGNPVKPYVLNSYLSITSNSPGIKALAMMEQADTSYIFVVDDGIYKGIVSIQGLAAMMSSLDG
jgi:CBS-domain-containing membrane protein